MAFLENLETGKAAESAIARWLIRKGHSVLPVYEKIIDEGKGPQLFTLQGGIVAPDMVVFTANKILWVEAKHKTAFTWWRKGQVFETGIDLRHYEHYQEVAKKTALPVWLLFLHKGGQAVDSPPSPAGLFGNELAILQRNESHRSTQWGKSGMVYWSREGDGGALKTIALYEEIILTKNNP